jgi:Arc/MetJ family transcription regulator
MKVNIEINDDLIKKAKNLSGITNESVLIEKTLQFYVAIESQKRLKDLYGKIELDDEAFK